ncbi:MAG: hypothetical protein ACKVQC_03100 [Elusimicrobiota bacterium]
MKLFTNFNNSGKADLKWVYFLISLILFLFIFLVISIRWVTKTKIWFITDPMKIVFIDSNSNQPIPGVLVMTTWQAAFPNLGSIDHNIDKKEYLSDKNGLLGISKNKSWHLFSFFTDQVIDIFHPYYQSETLFSYKNGEKKIIPFDFLENRLTYSSETITVHLISLKSKYKGIKCREQLKITDCAEIKFKLSQDYRKTVNYFNLLPQHFNIENTPSIDDSISYWNELNESIYN